jgi:hypothetical protein
MTLLSWSILFGCGDGADEAPVDDDRDGVAVGADCDDRNDAIHPGVDERCNAIDDDCDGDVDEDAVDAPPMYSDADGDGYGAAANGGRVRARRG